MATKEIEVSNNGAVTAEIAGGDANNRIDVSYKDPRVDVKTSLGKAFKWRVGGVTPIVSLGAMFDVSGNRPGTTLAEARRQHEQDSSVNFIDTPINPRTTLGFYPAMQAMQQIGVMTKSSFNLNDLPVGGAFQIVDNYPVLSPSDQAQAQKIGKELQGITYTPPAQLPTLLADVRQALPNVKINLPPELLTSQNAAQVIMPMTLGKIDALAKDVQTATGDAQAYITNNGGQKGIEQDIQQGIDARLTASANTLLALASRPAIAASDLEKAAGTISAATAQIAALAPGGEAAALGSRLTASVNTLLADAKQPIPSANLARDIRNAAAAINAEIPNVPKIADAVGAKVPKVQADLAAVNAVAKQITTVDAELPSAGELKRDYDRATRIAEMDPQAKLGLHVAAGETSDVVNAAVVAQGMVAAGVNNASYTPGKGLLLSPAELESVRVEVGRELRPGGNGGASFSEDTRHKLNLALSGDNAGVYGFAQETRIGWRGAGESLKSTEFGVGVNATKSLGENAVGFVAAEAYTGHTIENLTPGSTPPKSSDKGVGIKFGLKF
jgi:hypothetical protein